MKTNLYKIIFCICAAALLISVAIPFAKFIDQSLDQKRYQELSSLRTGDSVDWNRLKDINPDIYAWIYVPNTNIDYPIVQHPTDDSYYLYHSADLSQSTVGAIFSESGYNGTDFRDFHTVLYGHNMKNGSMFHSLLQFEDESFFRENPSFYIYTPDGNYMYEVFAAYEHTDEHLLNRNNREDDLYKQEQINKITGDATETGIIRKDNTPSPESHMVTLSTCVGNDASKRFLVVGVLSQNE